MEGLEVKGQRGPHGQVEGLLIVGPAYGCFCLHLGTITTQVMLLALPLSLLYLGIHFYIPVSLYFSKQSGVMVGVSSLILGSCWFQPWLSHTTDFINGMCCFLS